MKKIFAGHFNVALENGCKKRDERGSSTISYTLNKFSLLKLAFAESPEFTKLVNASLSSLALFFVTACFGASAYSLSVSFQIISLPNKRGTVPQALTIKVSLLLFSLINMSYLVLCTYLPPPALTGNSFVTKIQGQFYCSCIIFSLYIMLSA